MLRAWCDIMEKARVPGRPLAFFGRFRPPMELRNRRCRRLLTVCLQSEGVRTCEVTLTGFFWNGMAACHWCRRDGGEAWPALGWGRSLGWSMVSRRTRRRVWKFG